MNLLLSLDYANKWRLNKYIIKDFSKLLKKFNDIFKSKSNLQYTRRGILPKSMTGGGAHFSDRAPGQHRNVAAEASRWRLCPI